MKTKIYLSLIAVTLSLSIQAQNVGEPAPDFTLNTVSGETFTLSDHLGNVILIFFFGNACPSCIANGPSIQEELVDAYAGNENYTAVGLDVWNGNQASVESFKNSTGLTMPLCLMAEDIAANYGTNYDRLVVIDKDGNIAFKGTHVAGTDLNDAKNTVDDALSEIITDIEVVSDEISELNIFPNPASSHVNINLNLKESGNIRMEIISIDGKLISTPVNGFFSPGQHRLTADLNGIAHGLYFISITTGTYRSLHKITVNQ